jgi:hypothetical protein
MPQRQSQAVPHDSQLASIPDGFVEMVGPNGDHDLVPEYLIPATHQAFDAYRKQVALNVQNEQGGVSLSTRSLPIHHASFVRRTHLADADADIPIITLFHDILN